MKIKHIWLFITSLLLYTGNAVSQDSLLIKKKKGLKVFSLRLGIDLFKPIKTNFEDDFQGLEIVGDLKITWGNKEKKHLIKLKNLKTQVFI